VAPAPDSKPSTPPQTPPPVAQSRPVVPVGRGLEQWLAKNADVVVQTMEGTDPVVVRVGQTLGITNPNADSAWQVDVPGEALKMLTPADKVNKPGESGWVWRAMEPGTIELALTARTPCPNPPCGQAVLRLTKTVEIKPRQ
jgi:predicted secreted protein